MSADFDIPMFGQLTINWSAGVDENGWVLAYIGVAQTPGELFDNDGTALDFQEPVTRYGDESIEKGVLVTAAETFKSRVIPRLVPPMVEAIKELRERQGGYVAKEDEADDVG